MKGMGRDLTADTIVTDRVQRRILEVLLEESRNNPSGFGVHRSDMKRALNISEKSMDFNIFTLRKMNFVSFVPVPNFHWLWAKITGPGINAIEDTLYHEKRLSDIDVGGMK
jgi:hypothetical protein